MMDLPLNEPADTEEVVKPSPMEKPKGQWRTKIEASRTKRKKLATTWKTNVNYRMGKPFENEPDTDTVNVPVDNSRTKNKAASLFFQCPKVILKARRPDAAGAVQLFAAALNFEMEHEARAYTAMDECLGDVINASGFAAAMIGYDASFETVELPPDTSMIPPEQLAMMPPPEPELVERAIYECYYVNRISPNQFLWPADFIGSDWQKAEWLGYEGRIPLAEALRRQWVDEDYESECEDKLETVNDEIDEDSKSTGKYVKFSEIFYRKNVIDPMEKDPRKIGHIVIVDGKDKPAVDEDFKWQQYSPETRQWIGLTSFPIKVMTLTTISDESIPPSDSEMGRPQVREMIKFRSQMLKQRDASLPVRWVDVNMMDSDIVEQLQKGVYQDFIPMNGPGDRAVGEVARANFPRENYDAMRVIEGDLNQSWSMSENQIGVDTAGDTSATEATIIANASQTRLSYEQARVLRFFLEWAEAMGSLMQLFQDQEKWVEMKGDDGASLQAWDKTKIRGDFLFEAKPDSAVKVDVNQKRIEALNLYKLVRRDPLINPQALVADLCELHGLDPTKVMAPPPQPQPKPAALRFSFTGPDLTNPAVVALVQKNSPTPLTPEDIQAAMALMNAAGIPAMPPQLLNVPEPGQDGQPPSPEQMAEEADEKGDSSTPIENPAEQQQVRLAQPGPMPQVDPLGQRYQMGNEA
jgi:hypothetical protein